MRCITVDPLQPEPDRIAEACAVLRQDGLVVLPTETVYGLAARLSEEALQAVFRVKQRPAREPLPIQVRCAEDINRVSSRIPDAVSLLVGRWLPGPLTIVLSAARDLPYGVTAGTGKVGVRIPEHQVIQAVLAEFGEPLAVTSANRHGLPAPVTVSEALAQLGDSIALFLDAGPSRLGRESTALDLTADPPRILRPGAVSRQELESVLGPLAD